MSRRRFQFGLRTLLVVVTLLAIPCAFVGATIKQINARQAFRSKHSDYDFTPAKPQPTTMRTMLGDVYYSAVDLPLEAMRDGHDKEAGELFPEASLFLAFRQTGNGTP